MAPKSASPRSYDDPITVLGGSRGIVARVMRTARPVFLPDTSVDPEFVAASDGLVSEICVPLLAERRFRGPTNASPREGRGVVPAVRTAATGRSAGSEARKPTSAGLLRPVPVGAVGTCGRRRTRTERSHPSRGLGRASARFDRW